MFDPRYFGDWPFSRPFPSTNYFYYPSNTPVHGLKSIQSICIVFNGPIFRFNGPIWISFNLFLWWNLTQVVKVNNFGDCLAHLIYFSDLQNGPYLLRSISNLLFHSNRRWWSEISMFAVCSVTNKKRNGKVFNVNPLWNRHGNCLAFSEFTKHR